jgi:proprotein convertase subtilisin/kexin type 5
VICPPGCEKCTYYLEKIYCTSPMSGYAIDSNGDIVRCSDECATCASLDYKICTSCYGSSVLKQGTCIGCSDTYALTCPKNVNYAATCKVGYTPKAGKCQKCTDNCLLCTVTGPSQCDIDGCATGYVNILFTTTCTKCYSSCATCLRHNPGVCLTCGPSNYLSFNSSTCVGCPSNCLSCTSPTNCTSCPSDYILE